MIFFGRLEILKVGIVLEQGLQLVTRGHEGHDVSFVPALRGRILEKHDDLIWSFLPGFHLVTHLQEHRGAEIAERGADV